MCRAGTPWKGDGDHIPDDSDVAGVAVKGRMVKGRRLCAMLAHNLGGDHAQLHTHTLCSRQRPATNVAPPLCRESGASLRAGAAEGSCPPSAQEPLRADAAGGSGRRDGGPGVLIFSCDSSSVEPCWRQDVLIFNVLIFSCDSSSVEPCWRQDCLGFG